MRSDAEIVGLVKAGQIDAYAELVVRYERLVRAAAWHVVRDRHAADDATQEAFVAALQALGSLRDGAKFGPWLLAIARNRAGKALRARCRSPALVGDFDAHAADSRALTEASGLVLELLEQLPEHERIVVGLKNLQGHSVQEIAEITGRPVGTVTKQLSRGYERLRQWYSQETST